MPAIIHAPHSCGGLFHCHAQWQGSDYAFMGTGMPMPSCRWEGTLGQMENKLSAGIRNTSAAQLGGLSTFFYKYVNLQ